MSETGMREQMILLASDAAARSAAARSECAAQTARAEIMVPTSATETHAPEMREEKMREEETHVPETLAPETLTKTKDAMAIDNPGGLLEGAGEDFGEVLRHELNNPLTGILGNAELLLAEIRRNNDGRLPHGGLQRRETIAALAVRLRETIRRLSQEWEVRNTPARKNPGA